MKQITTLALALLASFITSASHMNSKLILSSSNHERIIVTIDNQRFDYSDRVVEVNSLEPGRHFLKVSKLSGNRRSGKAHLIYSGDIFIPAASRVTAKIFRPFRLEVVRVEPLLAYDEWNENECQPVPVICHDLYPMDSHSFEQLRYSISNKSFESTRLQIARQALGINYFTTSQVAEILGLFTFESTKLEFAKLAYNRTLDKQNYFLVNDAFTFESSIDELNRYIGYRI